VSAPLPDPLPTPSSPPPLTVAASLVGVEAVAFVLLAVFELGHTEGEKLVLGLTTALFFLVYGVFLAYAAWRLHRLHSWARAPLVLAQLIQVLVGASFWGGSTTAVAVVMILVGVVALAGIFHPDSLAALETRES
jgi:peptidoglycan/LPS O-acetylase OafA/YrhL